MRQVTDLEGRDWIIRLDMGAYMRINGHVIPDFLENEQLACEQMAELARKRVLLCRVLWKLCERQALDRNVPEDDFFCSFSASILEDCYATVVEAVADFFPHLRPMTSRILKELTEARNQIESALMTTCASIPPGKLASLDLAGLKKLLSATPGLSEGSTSASTPSMSCSGKPRRKMKGRG